MFWTITFWMNTLIIIVSGLAFLALDCKLKLSQKLRARLKIKNTTHKIIYFIVGAIIIGIASGLTRVIGVRIFENELISNIISWAVFGAAFMLLQLSTPLYANKRQR